MPVQSISNRWSSEKVAIDEIIAKTNNIMNGGGNNSFYLMLDNGTTTTVNNSLVTVYSCIQLMPTSASSAAITGIWFEVFAKQFIIHHSLSVATDLTFRYSITGS